MLPLERTASDACPRTDRACRGVEVAPGDDLQALIDANPPRTSSVSPQGVYRLSDTIETGEKFPTLDLRAGAVIDGQNGSFIGINGPDAPAGRSGTIILGGVVPAFRQRELPDLDPALVVRRNGVVEGTEFRENFNMGLTVQGDNARVVRHLHAPQRALRAQRHDALRRLPGTVGRDHRGQRDRVQQHAAAPIGDDAGGTKFVSSDGMIVRGNEVHDNYGAGLWWDGFNTERPDLRQRHLRQSELGHLLGAQLRWHQDP